MARLKPTPKIAKVPTPILIVCEDEKSIKFYLEDKKDALGISDNICRIVFEHDKSTPDKVVACAIRKSNNDKTRAKREGDIPYRYVYCVMDVDDHDTLDDAIEELRKHHKNEDNCDFISIVSNECAEVWLYLHFDYTTAPLERKPSKKRKKSGNYLRDPKYRLDKLLEKHLGQTYDKSGVGLYDLLNARGGDEFNAIRRAESLENHHKQSEENLNGMYYGNPSTELYRLIEHLNEIGNYVPPTQLETLATIQIKPLVNVVRNTTEDVFLQHLAEFIDENYNSESLQTRKELLQTLFEQTSYCRVYIDHKDKINEYFYPTYYGDYDYDGQEKLLNIVQKLDVS